MLASDSLTPDVTQRKLANMQRFRFNATALEALTELVLNECSLVGDRENPVASQSLIELSLAKLVAMDKGLASWLNIAAMEATGGRLSESLVRSAEWLDESEPAQRLWQVANMAVRLKTLEQRFNAELERQKREAIYHFAYGLSHELNNPLANIATRAGVLVHGETAIDRRQMLETIIDNAMRGGEMLGDLMLIARPPKMQFQSVNVQLWFAAFVERARKWSLTRGVTIESSLVIGDALASLGISETADFIAHFDPVAMNEALWCITRNAIEVSPAGGAIAIGVEVVNQERPCSICWSVHDSGPGLSEDALRHCFDPYFSGREAGRGLGLGLCKAKLIATAHGGTLTLANIKSGNVGSGFSGGCEALLTLPLSLDDQPEIGL